MGVCLNCNFRGENKPDLRRNPHLRKEDFICLNENNAEIDFVTGESKPGSCRHKNNFGECLFYSPVIPYESLKQLDDYKFAATYDVLDYDYSEKYFKEHYPDVFGCTSIRKDNLFGRNYDWTYDEKATLVINTPHKRGKNAVLGVASVNGLTKEFIESVIEDTTDKDLSLFKIAPFMLLDGINEHGLTASINVVPNDKGDTVGTVPKIKEKDRINTFEFIRYVLDNFVSATQAINYIINYVSIYSPKTEGFKYECHYLLADETGSYCIDFINNEIKVTVFNEVPAYITNFHTIGVEFDEETNHVNKDTVEPFGMGVERFDIVTDSINDVEDINDMRELLDKLRFTKAYTEVENPWYTEFTGDYTSSGHDKLTVQSDPSEFEWILEHERTRFENRSRDPESENFGTWQTAHSSIYDIPNRTLHLTSQETDTEFTFSVNL